MLRIECPWCGLRDEPEFTYGGESEVARPSSGAGDEDWARYLFFRSNPKGELAERWCHSFGCGQWFNVLRNTETHEILATYGLGEAAPRGREQKGTVAFSPAAVPKQPPESKR